MTHEEKDAPGAATPGETMNIPRKTYYTAKEVDDLLMTVTRNSHVNIDGGPVYNKEQVLHLIETLKVDDPLLQKRHLQRHRRNGFLRKLCVLRDRFLNRNSTDRKPLNKRRKFRH